MRRCSISSPLGSRLTKTEDRVNARLLDGFADTADEPTFDGEPLEVRFIDNADR